MPPTVILRTNNLLFVRRFLSLNAGRLANHALSPRVLGQLQMIYLSSSMMKLTSRSNLFLSSVTLLQPLLILKTLVLRQRIRAIARSLISL
jgi:hypothetical protein